MITEYIYENQEYENVLVKIKAALMDIISSEENKLYETTIAVRRLFYNVPARMKFLKKN